MEKKHGERTERWSKWRETTKNEDTKETIEFKREFTLI
jgi:hypothetical protein